MKKGFEFLPHVNIDITHTTTAPVLAWLSSLLLLLLAGSQRVTSVSSSASSLALHPMPVAAVGGLDDLSPDIALVAGLVALDEVSRAQRGIAAREAHAKAEEEDLKDKTSIRA